MNKEIIVGTLIGVRDGPIIVIEVRGQERKFPLRCELTVNWVYAHIDKTVVCLVEDGKVTAVD